MTHEDQEERYVSSITSLKAAGFMALAAIIAYVFYRDQFPILKGLTGGITMIGLMLHFLRGVSYIGDAIIVRDLADRKVYTMNQVVDLKPMKFLGCYKMSIMEDGKMKSVYFMPSGDGSGPIRVVSDAYIWKHAAFKDFKAQLLERIPQNRKTLGLEIDESPIS